VPRSCYFLIMSDVAIRFTVEVQRLIQKKAGRWLNLPYEHRLTYEHRRELLLHCPRLFQHSCDRFVLHIPIMEYYRMQHGGFPAFLYVARYDYEGYLDDNLPLSHHFS